MIEGANSAWPLYKRRLGLYPPKARKRPASKRQAQDQMVDTGPTLDEVQALKPGIIVERDGNKLTRNFASWSEFVDCVKDDSLFAWKRTQRRQSHAVGRSEWAGTETFEDAVRMATITGWPEGLALMQDMMSLINARPEPFKSIEFSVAGAFPLVPLYCAGDPDCMVIDPGADIRHSKPVIRIDCCIGGRANVEAKSLMLRGAAILSLTDAIERKGISTELRIVHSSRGSDSKWLHYAIAFKKAGEPLDLNRAVFALAHPATFRRFGFALVEQHAEFEPTWSNYGYTEHVRVDSNPDTIFIPGAAWGETPETAREAVFNAASSLLDEFFETETRGAD